MKISDLANHRYVSIVATIKEISPIKEFSKFGRTGRVATAIISDETGEMKLALWDEQIESLKPGDRIRVAGGFVKEWKGEKQMNIGKAGSIEVIK